MQYYTFELDDESKDLCTIITPFGKFRYRRLPMGLKCSPDFAQEVMESVLRGIDDADVYINDVGAFSTSWEAHIQLLDQILTRLKENGFTVNPLKCEWAVKETDWLGYWLTPTGLKPWKKKIDALLKMEAPRNLKELRSFIGAVNYYRDMWPSRAHVLAPLTAMTGKKRFTWSSDMQNAFQKMKAILAADVLTAYPNHNLPFHIYTDASDYQLGAAIFQNDRPVAYYTKKLTGAQQNYTTMEKELLSIVMTLKEFRSMLLGAELHVHTDHKNLTFENLTSQRVLRWRCFVEEYSPTLHYVRGPENVLADAYSRVPRAESMGQKSMPNNDDVVDEHYLDAFFSVLDEPELLDCFVNLPAMKTPANNPLDYEFIREQQQEDAVLLKRSKKYPDRYMYKIFENDMEILCYVKPGEDKARQWKIALPYNMLESTVEWFHQILGHPGSSRMRHTLQARYYHPDMRSHVDKYVCDACQRHKLQGRGYGLLPERNVVEVPWQDVAIDLIGPWKIPIGQKLYEFNALTCIDPVSNLTELVRIDNKTAEHVRTKFEQCWLARYPWPRNCIHDNGMEFNGKEFQDLLLALGIKDVPTTSRNPTANSICERMHQTVGNILRTILHTDPPRNKTEAKALVDSALATAQHAMRASISTTLGASPGSLVFSRDMFLNIPLIADWHLIAQRREQLVNESLRRQNMKRRRYDYVIGQKVLKKIHEPTKLGERTEGPYTITRVHVNGTVTISLTNGLTERINIRRIIPYKEKNQ
jgi:transposase InsO family protein